MEPRPGFALPQLWANSESAITLKTSPSYEVKDSDIRRAVMALTAVPAATLPESAFLSALGTPAVRTVLLDSPLAEAKALGLDPSHHLRRYPSRGA